MAEPYIPTVKDFDFFFKFLFAYFLLQVWAILSDQKPPTEKKRTKEDYEKTIAKLEAIPEDKLTFYEKIELKAAKTAVKRMEENPVDEEQEKLAEQRRQLFKFIFISMSMMIFAATMIGFLGVPARDVGNIAVFVFIAASLLKYLFDYTITDNQVRMIILSGIALYVDSLRETAGRIAAQF
ncbi:MAG: hypothetical protein ACO3SE_09930 [Sedimenticolaceae bacterium]